MRKLWSRTKDAVLYGYEAAKDLSGMEEVDDDPDFVSTVDSIEKYDKQLGDLRKTFQMFSREASSVLVTSKDLGTIIRSEISPASQNEEKKSLGSSFTIIETEVLPKIDLTTTRIHNLSDVFEKRYKNLLLSRRLQKEIEDMEKNGESVPESKRDEYEARKLKFNNFNSSYMDEAKKILGEKTDLLEGWMQMYNNCVQTMLESLESSVSAQPNVAAA